jgi:UDP-N-acetylglucosamine 2-epimerase (non-hydrolysing)
VSVPIARAQVLVCLGTRPEAIKLAPVIRALQKSTALRPFFVSTGQHREMLDQVLAAFAIRPDVDLGVMRPGQRLDELTAALVGELGPLVDTIAPAAVLVQGDTTTALAGALAAYYANVPLGHVEAGLRSGDLRAPFPEEGNRRLIGQLARWHFCPTTANAENLRREHLLTGVHVTGNTVIDALHAITAEPIPARLDGLVRAAAGRRRLLVTLHRRESQGPAQVEICRMLARLAERDDLEIVFPVHRSPAVRRVVFGELGTSSNVRLLEALDYVEFAHVLRSADLVLTDSGGIQEEAPTFGIPVVLARDTTERWEGIDAGVAVLAGTQATEIFAHITRLLDDQAAYLRMARAVNPYGDGQSAKRIVAQLEVDLCRDASDFEPGTDAPSFVGARGAPTGEKEFSGV